MSRYTSFARGVIESNRALGQRLQSDPAARRAAERWAYLEQARAMTGQPINSPGTRAVANLLSQGRSFDEVFEALGINAFDYVAAAQEMSTGGPRARRNMITIRGSGNDPTIAQTLPINVVAQRLAESVGMKASDWREFIPGGSAWEVLSPQIRHRIAYDAQNRDMRGRLDEMGDLGATTNPFQLGQAALTYLSPAAGIANAIGRGGRPVEIGFNNSTLRQTILENGVDNLATDSDAQTFLRASQGSLVGTGRGLLGDDRTYDELSGMEQGLQVAGDLGLYVAAGAGVGGAVRGAAAGIRAARAMQSATSAGNAARIGQAFSRGMTRLNESALGRFGQAAARNPFYRATAPVSNVFVGEFLEDAPIQATLLAKDRARETGRGALAEFLPALGETAKGYVNRVAALFDPNSDPGEKVMSAVLLLGMAAGAKTGAEAARRIKKENVVWSQFPQLNIEEVSEKTLDRVVDLARSIQRQDPDAAVELRNAFEQVLATATTPEGNINARDLIDQQARLAQTIAGQEPTGALFGDEIRVSQRASMDQEDARAGIDPETGQVLVPNGTIEAQTQYNHVRHEIEHIADGAMMDAINEMSEADVATLKTAVADDIRKRYGGVIADEKVEEMVAYWSGETEPRELARYLTEIALDDPRALAKLGLKGWRRFIPGAKSDIGKALKNASDRGNLGLYQGSRLSAVEVGALVRANEIDLAGPRSSTKPTLPDSFVSTGKRKLTGRKKGVRKVTQAEQLKIREEGHRAYEAALADGMTPEGAGNSAAATMQNSLGKLVSADFVRDVGERALAKFARKTKATAVAPAGRGDVDVVVWSDTQEGEFTSQGPAVAAIHGQSSPILAKKHRYSATIKESELTELKGSPETWDRQLRKRGVKGGIVEIEGQGEAVVLSPGTKLKYVGEQGEGEVNYMWVTSERTSADNTRALKRKAKKKAQVALGDRLRQEASKAGEEVGVSASYGVWQGSGEPSFEVAYPAGLDPQKAAELELHILNESRKAGQDTYGVVRVAEDGADMVESAVLDMTPEAAWKWMIANHEGGTVIKRDDKTIVVVASIKRWGGDVSNTPLKDSIIATGIPATHSVQAADVQFYGDKGGTKSYADREAELNQIIAGGNKPQRVAGRAEPRARVGWGNLSSERLTRAAEAQAQKLAREAVDRGNILFSLDPESPGGASLNIAEDTDGTGMRFYSRLEAAIRALPFKELEERTGREIPGEPLDPDSPDPNKVVARDKKGNPIVNPKTGEVVLRSRRLGGTVPGKSLRDVVMEALVGPMKKAPNSEGFMMTSFPEAGAKNVSWKELAASGILNDIEQLAISQNKNGKKASITKEDLIALAQSRLITFEVRQNIGELVNSSGRDPEEFRHSAEESVFYQARDTARDMIRQIDEIDLGSYFDENDGDVELEASLEASDTGAVKLFITDYTLDEDGVEIEVEDIEGLSIAEIEQEIAYNVGDYLVSSGAAQSKAEWMDGKPGEPKYIEGTKQQKLTSEELTDLRRKLVDAVYAMLYPTGRLDQIGVRHLNKIGDPKNKADGTLQDWDKVLKVYTDAVVAFEVAIKNIAGADYAPLLFGESANPPKLPKEHEGTYTWDSLNGVDYAQAIALMYEQLSDKYPDRWRDIIDEARKNTRQEIEKILLDADEITLAGVASWYPQYAFGWRVIGERRESGNTLDDRDFTVVPIERINRQNELESAYIKEVLVSAMRSTKFGENVSSVLDEIKENWETISANSEYIKAVDTWDVDYFEQEIESEIEYYMDEYGRSDDPDLDEQEASLISGDLLWPHLTPGAVIQDILGKERFTGIELLINQGSQYTYWELLHLPSTHFVTGNLVHIRAAKSDDTIVFYEFQSDAFMDRKRLNRTLVNSNGDTMVIAATPSMTNEVGAHNHPALSNDMSWMMVRVMVSYAVSNDMNKVVLISRDGAMKTSGIWNPPKALYEDVPEAMRSFLSQFGEVEIDHLAYGTRFTISEEAADAVKKSGVPLMSKSFGEKPPGQAPGNAVWSRLAKALRGESAPQSQQDKAVATQKSPVTKARTKVMSRPDTVGIESLGGKPARGLVRQGNRKLTQEDVEKLGSSAQRDDVDDLIASGQAIPEILRRSWADAEAAGATMTGDIRQVLRERVKIGAGLTDAEERYYQKVRLAIRDEIARLETALAKLGPKSKKRATLAQDRDELLAYATDMARNHIDARGNTARALAIGQLAAAGARRGEVGVMRRIKALLGRELTPEEKTKASAIAVKAEVAYQAKVKADDSALESARERVRAASASLPKKVTWNDLKRCLL